MTTMGNLKEDTGIGIGSDKIRLFFVSLCLMKNEFIFGFILFANKIIAFSEKVFYNEGRINKEPKG